MNKFTVFSILFSLSVMVVMADLVIRDYVALKNAQTSVLTTDAETVTTTQPKISDNTAASAEPAVLPPDVEILEVPAASPSNINAPVLFEAVLNETLIDRSGFTEAVPVSFDGKIFQLFDVASVAIDGTVLFQINDESGAAVGVFLETVFRDEISSQQFYDYIRNKSRVYLDLSLNENNAAGERSFFINHVKKPDQAFLVVKQGKYVYALAYLKAFHPNVKTLISFLENAILDRQFSN